MFDYITIPIWLFLILFAVALWTVLDRVLIPSTCWFWRRRVNRVVDEISTRLDIQIKPFQITKRQVLIVRLVYDPNIIEAIQQEAVERDCPREIVQSEVNSYAKEFGLPGISAFEVETEVNLFIERLQSKSAPLYITTRDRVETILNALNMLKLRRLIAESDGLY